MPFLPTMPPHRQAALTSLAVNLGSAKICGTTIGRDLNAGRVKSACDAMVKLLRWPHAGHRNRLAGDRQRVIRHGLTLCANKNKNRTFQTAKALQGHEYVHPTVCCVRSKSADRAS